MAQNREDFNHRQGATHGRLAGSSPRPKAPRPRGALRGKAKTARRDQLAALFFAEETRPNPARNGIRPTGNRKYLPALQSVGI
jgi:hypothetical protein